MQDFLLNLPKVELHLHIEGSLEPELMFDLAKRNKIQLPYQSATEARNAYQFKDLHGFLNLYYQGMSVLHTEQDFYDMAMDYFKRARSEGVFHIDMHFDPQAHLNRGVPFEVIMQGLLQARTDAEKNLDLTTSMIMAFLRDLSEENALSVLEQAEQKGYLEHIQAIGLDSAEVGNPPSKFVNLFNKAKSLGITRAAHAGEEGPPSYIREALDLLDVSRIDHGIRCVEDLELVQYLAEKQIMLTVCPLSNVCLKAVDKLENHPIHKMIETGLNVTINSDDPAYFGGGLLDTYSACVKAFNWDKEICKRITANAINSAFMSKERRQELTAKLNQL